MTRVHAGTSGWAYSSWKPGFYPLKLASAKFLSYYASRLNSVELNYTFRRLPTEEQLASWAEATPSEFKFAVKAHQTITHMKRLRGAAELTSEFFSSLERLHQAQKLGPVLFQLPPFLKCDVPLLTGFLAGLPARCRAALEFRHTSWFCDEAYAALRKANAALCQAESDTLVTPEVETADFSYLRLRKQHYSRKTRGELARKVTRLARRGDVFVYFKHEESPEGALHAEELLAAAKSP